ncbi:hypothetical protein A6A40_23870 (plasmid) [Azospirillum humicireducens]|uniref:Methyltransferase type 11 domain-containing protein n=1 Tax=Azospirillum humicireducens TaxID=1226968 RepID=A0A2R4VUG2_9PROT|nr:methyltransferase domain-containing protein [Azospirillum humicireducens]AWB08080.1 hypothetical protein A6A40_23870 [Azospirillum humicireducens]
MMLERFINILRAPEGGRPLDLEVIMRDQEHIQTGILRDGDRAWFPIINGVPVLLAGSLRPSDNDFAAQHGLASLSETFISKDLSAEQRTMDSFSDKWRRFKRYGLEPEHQEFFFSWYCAKLGLPDMHALKRFYRKRQRVLEVGPGSGFNTRFIAEQCSGDVVALDISDAAYTTHNNIRDLDNCVSVRGDILLPPFAPESFDLIIADGVLHHTSDTNAALRSALNLLQPGGQMFFYVYRKMGAARQFVDQHIRAAFSELDPEQCYEACTAITELGRALSDLNINITLDKPIDILGIPAGSHNIQRLLYYNFMKCFWNDSFDFETNNMINYDWYHPHYAWQHDETEVREWLEELGISDYSFNPANPNGLSILLRKPE